MAANQFEFIYDKFFKDLSDEDIEKLNNQLLENIVTVEKEDAEETFRRMWLESMNNKNG